MVKRMIGFLCCLALTGIACSPQGGGEPVARWHCYETAFQSSKQYANPIQEAALEVVFTGPDGGQQSVYGFWDGGDTWRVRFMPDTPGTWTWRTSCSDAGNTGLHEQAGSFHCIASTNEQALYQRGRLRLSDDGYRLAYQDGTPFFWLACTAWNGALFSDEPSWEDYLNNRVERGFTAIQFVTTQWRGAAGDIDGRTAFSNYERIAIDPAFFQRLDAKVDAINAHGLLAVPVMLWALPTKDDVYSPGLLLDNEQAARLARYIKARYGAHHVFWFLGGDGKYTEANGDPARWRYIGRQVFGEQPNTGERGLATLHPGGGSGGWCRKEYIDEPWYTMVGYQSSHNVSEGLHTWVCTGAPATEWKQLPPKPVINLEPAYDGIRESFDDYVVRRICYWSMLVSPPAGVTYGANSIWAWALEAGKAPLGHRNPCINTWREAMMVPSGTQMGYLRRVFEMVDWWTLYPVPEMVVDQPGRQDIQQWVAVAAAQDRSALIAYTPVLQPVVLDLNGWQPDLKGQWFDPRSGRAGKAFDVKGGAQVAFVPPGEGDWVLIVKQ